MTKSITVRLDEELFDRLDEIADLLGLTRSDVMRSALIEFINNHFGDPVEWDDRVSVKWRPPRWY